MFLMQILQPLCWMIRALEYHREKQWEIPSSMSLENLLRILPVGVVSKNFIGLRRILRKSSSWSREEARSVPWGAKYRAIRHPGLSRLSNYSTGPKPEKGKWLWRKEVANRKGLRLTGCRSLWQEASCFRGASQLRINPRGARQKPDHTATGEKRSRGPSAYLDKDHPANGFQDQHDCHGEGVDAGIVVHERIVLHAVAHRRPVFLSHRGVLFGSKVLWGKTLRDIQEALVRATLGSGRVQDTNSGSWWRQTEGRLCLFPLSSLMTTDSL